MVGDASEHVGEPGLRIDVVHFRRDDQGVHERGSVTATVGAGEQPGLPAERDTTQGPLGGIVGQADPAVLEEPGKARYRLFSALLSEAKPLKLRRAAIDNLPGFRGESG